MSTWILHLSDPHLGGAWGNDDNKIILAQEDLETTQTVFLGTLRKLAPFIREHGKPSVVVVSGDLTVGGQSEGFEAFIKLLQDRDDVFPEDPANTVVVPGNHDVNWDVDPGVPARYEDFLGATRAQGCSTPLLDGVDFAAGDESGALSALATTAPHVVALPELLVIPINSSNYCGSLGQDRDGWTTEQWEKALAPLGGQAAEVLEEVERLRHFDIARVSRPQIEALGHLFAHLGESQGRSSDDERVRVAVLHHQLLPVSEREERKPFESLINLGLVRHTLRDYAVDLALHGHKHESGVYWDVIGAPAGSLETSAHRVLVLSSPGHFRVGEPVMRAIVLGGNPRARSVSISTFLGPSPRRKSAPVDASMPEVPLWLGAMEAESAEPHHIRGRTAHVTYARLRGALGASGSAKEVRNLVCQVDDPSDATVLPPDYPGAGTIAGRTQEWFDDLVTWWQLDRSELVDRDLVGFNHGTRVSRRWGNQIARAARILDLRPESSRALIQLVAPRETGRYDNDERALERGSFPAFVLAEVGITKRGDTRYLDCSGYFRKQELQYWWPVNLAELARIQSAVLERLASPKPSVGRLVTFSAIALWSDALPRVAVPDIDRLVDVPDGLWKLAVALIEPGGASAASKAEWFRVLDDLAGTGRDQPPRPKLGVRRLIDELGRGAAANSAADVKDARAALDELAERYDAVQGANLTPAAQRLIRRAVENLRTVVVAALGPAESAS